MRIVNKKNLKLHKFLKDYYNTFDKIILFNLQIYNFRQRKYILIKYDQKNFNITAFGFNKTYSIVQHILTFFIFFTEIGNERLRHFIFYFIFLKSRF